VRHRQPGQPSGLLRRRRRRRVLGVRPARPRQHRVRHERAGRHRPGRRPHPDRRGQPVPRLFPKPQVLAGDRARAGWQHRQDTGGLRRPQRRHRLRRHRPGQHRLRQHSQRLPVLVGAADRDPAHLRADPEKLPAAEPPVQRGRLPDAGTGHAVLGHGAVPGVARVHRQLHPLGRRAPGDPGTPVGRSGCGADHAHRPGPGAQHGDEALPLRPGWGLGGLGLLLVRQPAHRATTDRPSPSRTRSRTTAAR